MKDGRSIVAIDPILPHHRGGGGSEAVNGAIIAYLFDCGMGAACDSLWLGVPIENHRTSTMDMAISYVRPVYGEVCHCESFVVGGGRNVVYTRGEVKDAEGTVCAHALGSYRIWPGGDRVVPMPGPPVPEFKPDAPETSSR